MKFSPGIFVAAVYICIVYGITESASQWWLWLSALGIVLVVDGLFGVHVEKVPVVEGKKMYVQDKEKPDEKDVQHPSNTV